MVKDVIFDRTAFSMGSHEDASEHQYEQWRRKNAEELFDEVQQLINNVYNCESGIDTSVFSMRKHTN